MAGPGVRVSAKPLHRRIGVVCILLLIAAMACRFWGVQGLLLPMRVVSGSMGDALVGPHWIARCQECGFSFACGTDVTQTDRAVCPNCGYAEIDLGGKPIRRGCRVLLDRMSLLARGPKRWDVVAVRLPSPRNQLAVKRIVGLPNEHLSIRNGDIYADGRIVRKTLAQLRSVSILVHDDRFRPRHDKTMSRWRPEEVDSQWSMTAKGYRFGPSSANSQRNDTSPKVHDMDWLSYHHRSSIPSIARGRDETPLMDNYAYNQGLARELNTIDDVGLSCRVRISGLGQLTFVGRVRSETFQIQWNLQDRQVRLTQNGRQLVRRRHCSIAAEEDLDVEMMVFDRQVVFALNGIELVNRVWRAPAESNPPTSRPFSIGARNVNVDVMDLQLWRDIFYLNPDGSAEQWTLDRDLRENEYLLLGDNCPVSTDGRHAARYGIVSSEAIGGRILPFLSHGPNRACPRTGVARGAFNLTAGSGVAFCSEL